jgi:hypothetical protein
LPDATAKLNEQEATAADEQRQMIGDRLLLAERALAQVQEQYALSAAELATLSQLVTMKLAELRVIPAPPVKSPAKAEAAKPVESAPSPPSDADPAPANADSNK